jgi:hypothetical protein
LYAGGDFVTAGGLNANNIARWNGSAWAALGSGVNSTVNALAVDNQNVLYAGGAFVTAGGAAVNRIARWNGLSWSPLGSGMNGPVLALDVDDQGILYAGGDFVTAGGVSALRTAQFNASSWSGMGSGMNNTVTALKVNAQQCLFAGGLFITAGGITANRVARWSDRCRQPFGTVVINNGAAFTANPTVVLSLSGNQIAQMRFSNDGSNFSPLEPFASTRDWTLSAGSGPKTVFAQFVDTQGVFSSVVFDSIVLDTLAPDSTASSPPFTCDRDFSVTWSGTDALSGIVSFDLEYRIGPVGAWTGWLSGVSSLSALFGPVIPVVVQPGDTYYFRVRARDQAGNVESFPGGNGNTQTAVLNCPFGFFLPTILQGFSIP